MTCAGGNFYLLVTVLFKRRAPTFKRCHHLQVTNIAVTFLLLWEASSLVHYYWAWSDNHVAVFSMIFSNLWLISNLCLCYQNSFLDSNEPDSRNFSKICITNWQGGVGYHKVPQSTGMPFTEWILFNSVFCLFCFYLLEYFKMLCCGYVLRESFRGLRLASWSRTPVT